MRSWIALIAGIGLTLSGCTTMEKEEKEAQKEEKILEKQAAPFLNACRAEAEKICKSAGNDKQKLAECLKQNKDKVAASCRSAIENAAKGKK